MLSLDEEQHPCEFTFEQLGNYRFFHHLFSTFLFYVSSIMGFKMADGGGVSLEVGFSILPLTDQNLVTISCEPEWLDS